jgi:predicted enzyme related to lactoylglutathione lyase
MPRPVHFEIPSDNPERAMAFYSAVFGWTYQKFAGPMDYWLITTGPNEEPGINGGILPRRDPAQPCVNTVGVANLDETQATIEAQGGSCCLPKMPVPGVGWLAYFRDPDGHIFGAMQPDSTVTA